MSDLKEYVLEDRAFQSEHLDLLVDLFQTREGRARMDGLLRNSKYHVINENTTTPPTMKNPPMHGGGFFQTFLHPLEIQKEKEKEESEKRKSAWYLAAKKITAQRHGRLYSQTQDGGNGQVFRNSQEATLPVYAVHPHDSISPKGGWRIHVSNRATNLIRRYDKTHPEYKEKKKQKPESTKSHSTSSATEEHSGKKSGTKEHSGKKSGTKEHSGKKSGTKEHLGKKSGTKEHSGKKSGTKEHLGKKSGTKEHLGKKSGTTTEHSGKKSDTEEYSGKKSGTKEHSRKKSGTKEHSGKKSDTEENFKKKSDSKEHSREKTGTEEHSARKSSTDKTSEKKPRAKEHSRKQTATKEHSGKHTRTEKHSGQESDTEEHSEENSYTEEYFEEDSDSEEHSERKSEKDKKHKSLEKYKLTSGSDMFGLMLKAKADDIIQRKGNPYISIDYDIFGQAKSTTRIVELKQIKKLRLKNTKISAQPITTTTPIPVRIKNLNSLLALVGIFVITWLPNLIYCKLEAHGIDYVFLITDPVHVNLQILAWLRPLLFSFVHLMGSY